MDMILFLQLYHDAQATSMKCTKETTHPSTGVSCSYVVHPRMLVGESPAPLQTQPPVQDRPLTCWTEDQSAALLPLDNGHPLVMTDKQMLKQFPCQAKPMFRGDQTIRTCR